MDVWEWLFRFIDGYIILRHDGLRNGGRGYRKTEFIDYQVGSGQEYKYVIHAVCANGVIGRGSTPIVANTASGDGTLGKPTAPMFSVLDTTGGGMRIGWDVPKSQGSKKLDYESEGGAFRVFMGDINGGEKTLIDTETQLEPAHDYGMMFSKWVYNVEQWRDSDVSAFAVNLDQKCVGLVEHLHQR